MKCQCCGKDLPENEMLCPACGWENTPESEREETPAVEGEIPAAEAETVPAEDMDLASQPGEEESVAASPEVKKMKRIAVISGCVAALAVLALVLFFGIRSGAGEKVDVKSWFDWEIFRANDLYKQDSYTVSDSKAESKADTVVATVGDAKLTNGQLQVYYQMQFMDFVSQYSYYLSYFGLDYTKPLDEQACPLKEGYTWQQYFLEMAIETWRGNQALALKAKEDGFQLDSEYLQRLDSLEADLTESAAKYGFDSAAAMLKAQCGANVTVADYRDYLETYYIASMYFDQCYQKFEQPTDEALATYFQENKEALEEAGILQDGSYSVDVRRILVAIKNIAAENPDEEGEKGTDGYTQAQWDACWEAAQAILDQWKENPTEENFSALANEKSHDQNGNVTDGGIYTDVVKGQMVEEFETWCFEENRQAGDYGIVKTKYGYHVMYFSQRNEELWLTNTRSYYLQQQANALVSATIEKYEMEVSYGKIALANVDMG